MVDPPGLVPLGPDDVQPAQAADPLGVFGVRRVAPQDDVDAPPGHVGRDRDGAGAARLGDDLRLFLVVLGVQHLVGNPATAEEGGQPLALLDRPGPDQDRPPLLVPLLELIDHGLDLALLILVHEVREVLTDHRPVGRDHHDREVVDLGEFRLLGLRRPGHARQLVVHPEVVLEGDGRQRLALLFDPNAFLGLDRLVEPIAVAPPEHQAPRKLVDDDDLPVLHHVLDVAVVQGLRAQRLLGVVHQLDVLRIGQVVDPEEMLHGGHALLGQRGGPELLVHPVVALRLEPGHVLGELVVELDGLLDLARDDEGRPRLVDEDEIDLVHDGVVEFALDEVIAPDDHVVPQIVEPELVVGSVGDVGQVGFAPGHRTKVVEALIPVPDRIIIRRIVDAGELVGDHPDAQPQERVDGTHPARAQPGQVVVGGHEVSTPPFERVQREREGRDERFPFAGPHLGDLPAEEHRAPNELDVVMPLAEDPLAGLADEGERLGHERLEGFGLCALAEFFQLPAEGRFGEPFELGLERVDLLDEGLPQVFDDPLARIAQQRLEQLQHRLPSL